MVSALIIQSLFSCRAFWEFLLMEGQIDSYKIVITAFLSNEHTHQIGKEDRQNLGWYGCIKRWVRGRGKSPISVRLPNKLVYHLSPLWSFFLFLSASCLGGDWSGLRRSWVPCQGLPSADSPVRVACSGLVLSTFSEQKQMIFESANLIEMLCVTKWFHLHVQDIKMEARHFRKRVLLVLQQYRIH